MLMSAELKGCVTWFICFLDLLYVRYSCVKFYHCRICMTDFRDLPPPPSVSTPKRSILNRVRNFIQLFLPSVYKDPFQASLCDSAHFLCFSITSNVTIPCSVAFYLLSWVKSLVSPLCLKHLIFLKTFDWVKKIFIFNWSTQKYIKAKSPFLLVV